MGYTYHYQNYLKFNDAKFRRLTGVNQQVFKEIFDLFKTYVSEHWNKRGRKGEFQLEDKLLLTLRYLRDYPTFISLANEFSISEGYANKIFSKVSFALVKVLKLPNLEELKEVKLDTVLIDVSEQRTERPKKNKKKNIQENKKLILIKP
jgi:Helix-turn-helix of DDE superfamily endonuclease